MITETPVASTEIPCAFCRGKGKDPFGVFSRWSMCCVCGGRGVNLVTEPYVRCAFCQGTGVYPLSRLTCTACGGVGVTPVAAPHRQCPHCRGTGTEPGGELCLWCQTCHGAGVVQANE